MGGVLRGWVKKVKDSEVQIANLGKSHGNVQHRECSQYSCNNYVWFQMGTKLNGVIDHFVSYVNMSNHYLAHLKLI